METLTIPDEVIFEQILPRIPVKPLIRFKLVCKNWYKLISTSQFAKSHLHFSSSSPHILVSKFREVKKAESCNFYLIGYDEPSYNTKGLVQLDKFIEGVIWIDAIIVGCCNGLICLYFTEHKSSASESFFAVWNPATRQFRKICSPFEDWLCKYGFGYGSTTTNLADDYKIVTFRRGSNDGNTRLWIFSLTVGDWKQVDFLGGHDFPYYSGTARGVFVDDTLYWMFRECRDAGHTLHIASFDLVEEQFTQVQTIIPANGVCVLDLSVIKGWLSCCCCLARDQPLDVWVMKKQKGGCNSWEKLFSIPPRIDFFYLDIIHFIPTGKCLVKHLQQLKLVEPTLEDIEHSQGINFENGGYVYTTHHVESLISPFGALCNSIL